MSDAQSIILNPCQCCGTPTEGERCETCRLARQVFASIRAGRSGSRTWRRRGKSADNRPESGSHLRGCPPEREET